MKKFLLIAMAAIAMMACNSSKSDKNDAEEEGVATEVSLEDCSKKALALIGTAQKKADQAIINAGFEKINIPVTTPSAPARRMPAQLQDDGNGKIVRYAYNMPSKYKKNGITDDNRTDFINDVVSSGKMLIILQAYYYDGVLHSLFGELLTNASNSGTNKLYVTCSNNIYRSMPSGSTQWWIGELSPNAGETWDDVIYEEHSEFITALKRITYPIAYEEGGYQNAKDKKRYIMNYGVPDDDAKRMMREQGYKPYSYCAFTFRIDE